MRDFVITTDSTVDLPKEWLEEHRVPTLRLAYTIDGETYPDMEGLSKKEFFDRIRNGSLPTTSQVTPGQARELFESIIIDSNSSLACPGVTWEVVGRDPFRIRSKNSFFDRPSISG